MLKLLNNRTKWRSNKYLNELQVWIVRDYFLHLSWECGFPELPKGWEWTPKKVSSFKEQLEKVFLVPVQTSRWMVKRINKSQLMEHFLSFLQQLLHHNTDSSWRVKVLEKELRFLHTIFEDLSWMLQHCDDIHYEAQFQNLMEELEAVGNQAGRFIHSMLFSAYMGFRDKAKIAAALHRIDCLKATIESSDIFSATTFYTQRVSTANSFLHLHSLYNDLQHLLQGDRIADLKDQIGLLYQGLILLQSRSPQSSEIGQRKEILMCHIGDIALQAQYLITVFLSEDAPLWYVIPRFTYLNHRIHVITLQLNIKEEHKTEGLKMTKDFIAIPPLEDEGKINDSDEEMVGFEVEEENMLNQLIGEGKLERQVISMIGMPGLGKTTLARKLYNHPLVRERFDKLSWIVVSQSHEIRKLMRDILININNDLGKDSILYMEEETLVEHIHKTLKRRRYLVVMDDVWDSNVWDELQRCLPDDGNGSRILLTSRNQGVAPPNSIVHELPFLSDEQSWELLQKKVFLNRTCTPQLHPIGKKIAAKCRGLPLTVSVIAGALSSMDEEESAWEKVGESLAFKDGEDNTVMHILQLSYSHLPNHLKSCFLSFSAYKEDEEVSVGKLKRFWIAKGFIHNENERSKENVAEEYIMELINRSLVMVARRRLDGRGVKACVVHDLLRDLCLKISRRESFREYSSDGLTTCSGFGIYVPELQRECATLRFDQHQHSFASDGLSSSYVREMRLLRVLCFHNSDNRHCRCYIFRLEYLINLRYLVIDKVPPWIENLVNLEYLVLEFDEAVVYLPPTIAKLNKLRYIHALRAEYSEDWICSSKSNNNLEYLSRIKIKKLKDEELLKFSSHLRKLKCSYEVIPRRSISQHFDLSFLTQLDSLSLEFSDTYRGFELQTFGFPANIRKLTLGWSRMHWEKMSIVGRLKNLEVLKLCHNAFVGDIWDTRDGEFQKLRFLQLEDTMVCEWNVSSSEHFPRLQQLVLLQCHHLKEIPSEIGEIATLEVIEVKGICRDSLRESAERIKEEERDKENYQLNVIIDATNGEFLWRRHRFTTIPTPTYLF